MALAARLNLLGFVATLLAGSALAPPGQFPDTSPTTHARPTVSAFASLPSEQPTGRDPFVLDVDASLIEEETDETLERPSAPAVAAFSADATRATVVSTGLVRAASPAARRPTSAPLRC